MLSCHPGVLSIYHDNRNVSCWLSRQLEPCSEEGMAIYDGTVEGRPGKPVLFKTTMIVECLLVNVVVWLFLKSTQSSLFC